jgi:dihydrofolate reductase
MTTQILRDVEEIRKMKQYLGKDMLILGAATLASNRLNLGLIDEVRLMVNPIILGRKGAIRR